MKLTWDKSEFNYLLQLASMRCDNLTRKLEEAHEKLTVVEHAWDDLPWYKKIFVGHPSRGYYYERSDEAQRWLMVSWALQDYQDALSVVRKAINSGAAQIHLSETEMQSLIGK